MTKEYIVRHKKTGETLEVLSSTSDDRFLAGPPGRPEDARLVHRRDLEPDPQLLVVVRGWRPWTNKASIAELAQ